MKDTTGNTLDEIVPTDDTPMEIGWRDMSLVVVGPSLKKNLSFQKIF